MSSKIKDSLDSFEHAIMAIFLLEEKRKLKQNIKSEYSTYVDILPEDFSNFPIFFNDEELKLLEET